MKKIEQFRTTVRVSAITIFSLISTAIYYLVWRVAYNPEFEHPYHGKGQIFLAALYFVVLMVASIILGVLRIDELRRSEILFYGLIALGFTNGIAYTQICLVEAELANVMGMLYIFLFEALALIVWTTISSVIVHALNPPEKLLIIYGSHLATEIVYKMSKLEDRYVICESASVDEGFESLTKHIDRFESIIICDVPARLRNDLLKYSYHHLLSCYIPC